MGDAIVCDMNCHPRMAVDAVLALLPVARAGTMVVVTLKTQGGKSQMARDVELESARLQNVLGSAIRVLRLFSGGADERTVIGSVLPPEERRKEHTIAPQTA